MGFEVLTGPSAVMYCDGVASLLQVIDNPHDEVADVVGFRELPAGSQIALLSEVSRPLLIRDERLTPTLHLDAAIVAVSKEVQRRVFTEAWLNRSDYWRHLVRYCNRIDASKTFEPREWAAKAELASRFAFSMWTPTWFGPRAREHVSSILDTGWRPVAQMLVQREHDGELPEDTDSHHYLNVLLPERYFRAPPPDPREGELPRIREELLRLITSKRSEVLSRWPGIQRSISIQSDASTVETSHD